MHLLMFSEPISDIIIWQTPYLVKTCVKADATDIVSLFANRMVTKYWLNMSMQVNTYLRPDQMVEGNQRGLSASLQMVA